MCGSDDLQPILHMTPTPPGDHYVTAEALDVVQPVYPMDLMMCGGCALAQLADIVDPGLLYGNYIYQTSISLGLVRHFDQYAASVLHRIDPPPHSLVIDIGSNDGTLLQAFSGRGMRVLGVDPAREVARQACQAGLETLTAFFSARLAAELRRERGPAAIVTANNVFANVDDLDDLVDGIRQLLAPDGVFVFETGYFPDLVRQNIIDNIYHEHLSYYSVTPLVEFFRRHGLELTAVDHEPTKGGSIRGFVQLAERPGAMLDGRQMQALLDQERRERFDRPDGLRSFTERIEELQREVMDLTSALKAGGRVLAGYGASVGVTTLLYYFDLASTLSFVIDDNPMRHGRFTPGHHLPVLSSEALYDRKPDDVLLLAWRYADPIMSKHDAYTRAGGRFILPLPKVAVA